MSVKKNNVKTAVFAFMLKAALLGVTALVAITIAVMGAQLIAAIDSDLPITQVAVEVAVLVALLLILPVTLISIYGLYLMVCEFFATKE